MRPENYRQIAENRHRIAAGSILLPTDADITNNGASSEDFVAQQGGDSSTFIFIFGVRAARGPLGEAVEFIEGVFLNEEGPGFHPTWDHEQLLREVDLGGWKVVTTEEMLSGWVEKVEDRMNKGE